MQRQVLQKRRAELPNRRLETKFPTSARPYPNLAAQNARLSDYLEEAGVSYVRESMLQAERQAGQARQARQVGRQQRCRWCQCAGSAATSST